MSGEVGVQSNGCLLSRAEVVLGNRDHILFDLVVALENEGILGGVNLSLPKFNCTPSFRSILIVSADGKGLGVKTKILKVSHSLSSENHCWLAYHSATGLFEGSKSESGQHF